MPRSSPEASAAVRQIYQAECRLNELCCSRECGTQSHGEKLSALQAEIHGLYRALAVVVRREQGEQIAAEYRRIRAEQPLMRSADAYEEASVRCGVPDRCWQGYPW